jgi:hypothetical protein
MYTTVVVNCFVKEYENSASQLPPAPFLALDCTFTAVPAGKSPRKIDFNLNPSHARNPSENTDILIAWLIANGIHSQNSISTVNTTGYKFLIASISYVFGPFFRGTKLTAKKGGKFRSDSTHA